MSAAIPDEATPFVVMANGLKMSLPVTFEPRRVRIGDFFLIGVSIWMTAIFLGDLPGRQDAPGWLHYALLIFPILLVSLVAGTVVRLAAPKQRWTFSKEGFEDSWMGSVPWTSVSGLHRSYSPQTARLLGVTLLLIPGSPVIQSPWLLLYSLGLPIPVRPKKRFVIDLTRMPDWRLANELIDLLFNQSRARRAPLESDARQPWGLPWGRDRLFG